ncbi:MAG: hypothetical protein RLZZ352_1157 [Pseudomonadota bacterium]|jgi:hypothetical protein
MTAHPVRPHWRSLCAALCIAACLTSLHAQTPPAATATPPTTAAAANCDPAQATSEHLRGLWQLSLWPLDAPADQPATSVGTLRLIQHLEYPDSVHGQIQRSEAGQTRTAWVAGDLIEGRFQLDESADLINTDATWTGEPEDCNRTLRGTRLPAERLQTTAQPLRFVLRRPGP